MTKIYDNNIINFIVKDGRLYLDACDVYNSLAFKSRKIVREDIFKVIQTRIAKFKDMRNAE